LAIASFVSLTRNDNGSKFKNHIMAMQAILRYRFDFAIFKQQKKREFID